MHLDIVRRTYTAPDSIFFDFCRVFFALKKKTKCLNERFAWIGSDSRSHALYWCITSVRDCKSLILLFFLLTFGPQVQRVCWHVALGKCRFLAKLHVDPFFVLVYILVFIRWYRTLAAYIQKFIYRHTRQYTSCRTLRSSVYCLCFCLPAKKVAVIYENGERRATLRLANFPLLLFAVFFLYRFLLISLEGQDEEESIYLHVKTSFSR